MQKFILVTCLLSVFYFNSSAANAETISPPDTTGLKSIMISYYCSECMDRCDDMYLINKKGITIDTSDQGNFTGIPAIVPPFTINTDLASGYIERLIQAYPTVLNFESKEFAVTQGIEVCGVYITYLYKDHTVVINISADDYYLKENEKFSDEIIKYRTAIAGVVGDINKNLIK